MIPKCVTPKCVTRHWDASPTQTVYSWQVMPVPYPPSSHWETSLVSLSYSHGSRLINNPKTPSADDELLQETDGEGRGVGCTPVQDLCWLEKLPDKACAGGRILLMSF